MGRDKALIEVDGVTMVARTASVLGLAGCDPVVAIGPSGLAATVANLDELYPGEGPLGGVLTALVDADRRGATCAVVVACDLPDLDAATIELLLGRLHDAQSADARPGTEPDAPIVAMARAERLEPLVAAWSTSCRVPLQRAFDDGVRAMHRAIAGLTMIEVDVADRSVRNVNTPDQLRNE